jgi:hypothetical protein
MIWDGVGPNPVTRTAHDQHQSVTCARHELDFSEPIRL